MHLLGVKFVGDYFKKRPVKAGDEKVEVQFTSPGADDRGDGPEADWAGHNYLPEELNLDEWFRRYPKLKKYGIFPRYIPVSAIDPRNLEGEGGTVSFYPPDLNYPRPIIGDMRVRISVQAAQLKHRFAYKGVFESALAKNVAFNREAIV